MRSWLLGAFCCSMFCLHGGSAQGAASKAIVYNSSSTPIVVLLEVDSPTWGRFTSVVRLRPGEVVYNIPLSTLRDDQLASAYEGKLTAGTVTRVTPGKLVGLHPYNQSQFVFPQAYFEYKGDPDACQAFVVPLAAGMAKDAADEAMKKALRTDFVEAMEKGLIGVSD